MRVAFLSPCWPPDRIANGIASYVGSMRRGLAGLGVESRVLAAETDDDLDDPAVVRLAEMPASRPLGVRLRLRVADAVSRNWRIQESLGFRIAHAVTALDATDPLDLFEQEETFGTAAVVRRHFRKPVVVRLHGPWCEVGPQVGHPRDREFGRRCRAELQAIAGASGVSSPSRAALDRVRAFYGVALPDAAVIPNPVAVPEDDDAWRADHADPQTVLFVGRFDRVKGADVLLDAFARVAARRPALRLRFLGPDTGFMQGGREISIGTFLEDRIPRDVHDRIAFEGARPRAAVAEARRRAAVTVVASRFETFSLAVLEAMAAGSPVVATRAGGIPEMLRDGENGLLVPPEDAEALAQGLERLLDDPAFAARLGAAGRRDARAGYTEAAVAAATRDFHREVIARGR